MSDLHRPCPSVRPQFQAGCSGSLVFALLLGDLCLLPLRAFVASLTTDPAPNLQQTVLSLAASPGRALSRCRVRCHRTSGEC